MKSRILCILVPASLALLGGCEGPPPSKSWDPAPPGSAAVSCNLPGYHWWTCRRLIQGNIMVPDASDQQGVDGGCWYEPILVCLSEDKGGAAYAAALASQRYHDDGQPIPDGFTQLSVICQLGDAPGVNPLDYPVCATFLPTGAGGGPAASCGGDLAACSNDSDCCSGICSLNACGGQPGQSFGAGGAGGAGGGTP